MVHVGRILQLQGGLMIVERKASLRREDLADFNAIFDLARCTVEACVAVATTAENVAVVSRTMTDGGYNGGSFLPSDFGADDECNQTAEREGYRHYDADNEGCVVDHGRDELERNVYRW
jgi:hypothetical protein